MVSKVAVPGGLCNQHGVCTGRYMACELFAIADDGDVAKTTACDVFEFDMLVEGGIKTGRDLLHHDTAVLFAIVQGKRPTRATARRDTHEEALWMLAKRCWDTEPRERARTCALFSAGVAGHGLHKEYV
ncbi:hypothetical protein HDZ31DRAFT_70724, partial [Schizophyllum fasciatum]